MAQAIIMAGGFGERFQPLTHKNFPKYLIRFNGKTSLLQNTYARLTGYYRKDQVWVITTREHVRFIRKELPRLSRSRILIEPFRNNTASAILYGTKAIQSRFGSHEPVSFFPADHLIKHRQLFYATMNNAIALAKRRELLVTIGVKPTFPAIGYGYILAGGGIPGSASACLVKAFKEKPKLATAKSYLRNRNYFWNGGIFTWRAGVFMDTIKKTAPQFESRFELGRLAASYRRLPKISIDYLLLEKTRNIAVVKTRMDWCDMGSWDMFLEKAESDRAGNVSMGPARHRESRNSLFLNYTNVPVVALGVKDLIVVKTERWLLICGRGRSEEAARLPHKK